jgi:DNA-binding transcriptional LysR family regulator
MWETIELRELRVFLTLADELHFGRTAERLRLTQSRVSQTLRTLEEKLAGQLVYRTTRTVQLTRLGERFLADAGPLYRELAGVLESSSTANRSISGSLRLGLLVPMSAGPHLLEIISAFEAAHPGSHVVVADVPHDDPLGFLRSGEVDLLAARLPLNHPDVVPGPILSREPRVLAVAQTHPLASRREISIEDIAAYRVAPIRGFPEEIVDAFIPRHTPSGRPLRRLNEPGYPTTTAELTNLVARGRVVHPTVPSFRFHFGHPNIVYVPIKDMADSETALLWRRRMSHPAARAFVAVARDVLSARSAARTGPGPDKRSRTNRR